LGFAAISILFAAIVLFSALAYSWMFPEGGDAWDLKYCFTHPAIYVAFWVVFAASLSWITFRRCRNSS
jgi:hypothetical protein